MKKIKYIVSAIMALLLSLCSCYNDTTINSNTATSLINNISNVVSEPVDECSVSPEFAKFLRK